AAGARRRVERRTRRDAGGAPRASGRHRARCGARADDLRALHGRSWARLVARGGESDYAGTGRADRAYPRGDLAAPATDSGDLGAAAARARPGRGRRASDTERAAISL